MYIFQSDRYMKMRLYIIYVSSHTITRRRPAVIRLFLCIEETRVVNITKHFAKLL